MAKNDTFQIVTCPHCKRQCETTGDPDDTCFWCHKPLRKERKMTTIPAPARISREDYEKMRLNLPHLPPFDSLPQNGQKPTPKQYSKEERLAIARMAKERGTKVVGAQLGIKPKTLSMWIALAVKNGDIPRAPKPTPGEKTPEDTRTYDMGLSDLASLTPEETKLAASYLLGWRSAAIEFLKYRV